MSTIKRYLGVDPGSIVTGYACIEQDTKKISNKVKIIDVGVIKAEKSWDFVTRITALEASLAELIEELKPTHFSIEKAFSHKNPASALRLGEVRGVYILAASKAGLSIDQYTPKAIKKMVTGKGTASKEHVCQVLNTLLKIDLNHLPLDASDALAIAYSQSISNMMS